MIQILKDSGCDNKIDFCTSRNEGGAHIIVHVGENRHPSYLTCHNCEDGDDCNGGGTYLMTIDRQHNVGEPTIGGGAEPWECNGEEFFSGSHLISGELVDFGFLCEYVWSDETDYTEFCGGMRAKSYLFCRYNTDCTNLSEEECELNRDNECGPISEKPWICIHPFRATSSGIVEESCCDPMYKSGRWFNHAFCPCDL